MAILNKQWTCLLLALAMDVAISTQFSHAQYPAIPPDVQEEAARLQAEQERLSDEAWDRALPEIEVWAEKGKPYIPVARHPEDLPQAEIPAFPGAEGGGMYSFGGRGGKVIVVTNLNDRGSGSLREACEQGGPRIVVFNVAGIIRLESPISIRAPYITISGATAPGDGVCVAGATFEIATHDVVVRHMRFRRGETWVGDRDDALGGDPIGNVMIDHVSASWGLDENMSIYRQMYTPPGTEERIKLPVMNITIQDSISSEALNTYNHSFGSTIGGYNSTFMRNLYASNAGRNPSVGMGYDFTFINNVLFNWRHRTIDGGGPGSFYTIINNYFKPGPITPEGERISFRILKPDGRGSAESGPRFGKAYVAGNVVEGNEQVTSDNWAGGVQVDREDGFVTDEVLPRVKADEPYPHAYVEIMPADEAYEYVLENAGATLPRRDVVDERVVEMVRTGEVTFEGVEGGTVAYVARGGNEGHAIARDGIITDVEQVGGYPAYRGKPYQDTDGDGMPDEWEDKSGLDPNDPSDAIGDLNGNGYTNIEEFINGTDPTAPAEEIETPRTFKDLFRRN